MARLGGVFPSAAPLPLAAESANFRFYYSPGDSVQVARQEAFHEWAVALWPQRITPPAGIYLTCDLTGLRARRNPNGQTRAPR